MMKLFLSVVMLSSLLFLEGISRAGENGGPSQDETILLVSRSTITAQTEGSHRDQQRAIDARLKRSIAQKLNARGFNVVTSDDEDQKKQPDRYVLAYNLVYLKFGFLHPFGRSAKVSVDYVLEKSSETIASGQIAERSKRSWKRCINGISDEITDKIANTISGGVVNSGAGATSETAARAGRKSVQQPVEKEPKNALAGKNTLGFGVSGFMTDAYDDFGYTFSLSPEITVFRFMAAYAKIGYVAYRCDTESYAETARGMGAEIGARFYPGGRAQQGWYMGLGVGRWWVEGTWKDDLGTPFVTTGKGKTFLTEANIHTGYKMLFGPYNFYVDPSLQVASYDRKGTPGAFGQLGQTITAGVMAGILW